MLIDHIRYALRNGSRFGTETGCFTFPDGSTYYDRGPVFAAPSAGEDDLAATPLGQHLLRIGAGLKEGDEIDIRHDGKLIYITERRSHHVQWGWVATPEEA